MREIGAEQAFDCPEVKIRVGVVEQQPVAFGRPYGPGSGGQLQRFLRIRLGVGAAFAAKVDMAERDFGGGAVVPGMGVVKGAKLVFSGVGRLPSVTASGSLSVSPVSLALFSWARSCLM